MNHRRRSRSESWWYFGTAIALAFLLFQAWLSWNEQNQARNPYREPRGPAIRVQGDTTQEFSWGAVWQRLQEFYRVGE